MFLVVKFLLRIDQTKQNAKDHILGVINNTYI